MMSAVTEAKISPITNMASVLFIVVKLPLFGSIEAHNRGGSDRSEESHKC